MKIDSQRDVWISGHWPVVPHLYMRGLIWLIVPSRAVSGSDVSLVAVRIKEMSESIKTIRNFAFLSWSILAVWNSSPSHKYQTCIWLAITMKKKLSHISNINQILERRAILYRIAHGPLFVGHLIVQHFGVHRVTFYYREETEKGDRKGNSHVLLTGCKALHQGLFITIPFKP